jgi:hypothetical protein
MQQDQEPTRRPLFSLGDVVITPGALAAFVAAHPHGAPRRRASLMSHPAQ